VLAAFKKGITKINIGTEIRQVYESNLKASGKVSAAQEAVYERTSALIDGYFGLKDTQPLLMEGLP
jgi:fructose/tagatose bisphosphate aldolase